MKIGYKGAENEIYDNFPRKFMHTHPRMIIK
jgi:hypothetical protein